MSDEEGAPAWMVSFGDMMTLILTFFILLVSMSKEQDIGLVASGVGSFLVAVRSFGLPGLMDENEKASTFEEVRQRFNLPPEPDPNKRPEDVLDASSLEIIRTKAATALAPHDQISQPAIAIFERGSSELTPDAERYIDLLAPMLYPAGGQTLLLEGHALDARNATRQGNALLAFARANAVRSYLIEAHDFPKTRVSARAWLREIDSDGPGTRSVDARLVIPADAPR
ncbi:MAG TPA: hypothetical protein ENJ09_16190 [Planctomycetes bacterium]|nr:hypothetical protein [Planctomycetota bacterium]